VNTWLPEKEDQIYDYLRVFSAEWGILTNGKEFRVYQYTGEGNLPHHLATMEIEALSAADILNSLRRNQFDG